MALRIGQWVKLARTLGPTLPAGSVGIHHPLHPLQEYLIPELQAVRSGKIVGTSKTGFFQVDPSTGFETIRILAVAPEDLLPVLDLLEIPAPRRATFSSSFTLKP